MEVQQDLDRPLGLDGPVLCAGSPTEINVENRFSKKNTLFCQFHLRHSVEDILATKTEECCVCVSVQLDFSIC